MRGDMAIKRISAKRLQNVFGGKLPFSTITPKKNSVTRVSAKQRKKQADRRKLRERWWAEGNRTCGICGLPIRTFAEMTNDHILPGWGKSDAPENQQPAHIICNNLKGSKRNYTRDDCLRDLGLKPSL